MDPIVTEVIDVGHLLHDGIGEGHLLFIEQFALIPAKVTLNIIARHDAHPRAEFELVQMRPIPAEGDLDDLVQVPIGELLRQVKASPHIVAGSEAETHLQRDGDEELFGNLFAALLEQVGEERLGIDLAPVDRHRQAADTLLCLLEAGLRRPCGQVLELFALVGALKLLGEGAVRPFLQVERHIRSLEAVRRQPLLQEVPDPILFDGGQLLSIRRIEEQGKARGAVAQQEVVMKPLGSDEGCPPGVEVIIDGTRLLIVVVQPGHQLLGTSQQHGKSSQEFHQGWKVVTAPQDLHDRHLLGRKRPSS